MSLVRDKTEMRAVYGETLIELAKKDDRIVVLGADLTGSDGSAPFFKAFPDRSFNAGISEANMVGVAAGLAASGKIPFIDTFAPFITRRVYDQIAVSVAYSGLPVKLVGTSPGITQLGNGGTHMTFEDLALMRLFPNMVVFEPADAAQFRAMLPKIAADPRPCYIRMERKLAYTIYDEKTPFEIGKANLVREGSDVSIFSSGLFLAYSLMAAEALKKEGIVAEVVDLHTVNPMDAAAVVASAKKTGCAVTVENHYAAGGLGGAVCEILSENYPVPVRRVGLRDAFGETGTMEYLMELYHIDVPDILSAAKAAVAMKK